MVSTNVYSEFVTLQVQDIASKNKSTRRLGADGKPLNHPSCDTLYSFFRFLTPFYLGVDTR